MWLGAAIFAIPGVILAFNLGHSADRLARIGRAMPWWFKSPLADYAAAQRLLGVFFLLAAAGWAYAAMSH